MKLAVAAPKQDFSIFLDVDAYVDTFLNFGGPAGGSAPGRRFAPKSGSTWLVETDESEAPFYSNIL